MLHGNVELNGTVIGQWTATRTGPVKHEFNDYFCTIWYRGTDGYLYERQWHIWGHHAGNGAFSLAARVLQEGGMHAKRKRIRDD